MNKAKRGISVAISVFLILFALETFSQVVFNNGASVYIKNGGFVFVNGTVQNESGLIDVDQQAGSFGELCVQNQFINNALASGNGYYRVLGNWINNDTFIAGSGTVFLEGADQLISGSVSTTFNNLTLDGSGSKTQGIDQFCTGILDLKHLELQTEVFGFYVQNANTNAIERTTGFVSSLDGGFLSRNTSESNIYIFPVGSSLGVYRYRPVEIVPQDALANEYTVRMANVLSTTEGFDADALASNICEINQEFYHQINRTAGNSAIDLFVYYDESVDGEWDGLSNWTVVPDEWEVLVSSVVSGIPFNFMSVTSWNDFSEIPYSLYRVSPDASITDPGDFCSNDGSVNLTAVTSGGNWSGVGITDAVAGTFDPVVAGIGNHTISYTVGTGSCVSTDDIVLVVNAVPDATITDPGDFCSIDAAVNLTSATVGGSWSGPGITDAANGTFDPFVAGAGTHTISYTVSQGSCSGTDNIVIEVFDTPDATITDPGEFCSNDGSVNLTAVTSGGNWSGSGITDAVTGTFDPVFAGIGNHTISYTVGPGSCVSTDDIILVVNAVPDATITDPSDFCSSDAAVNLTSATVGGSWSGPGITDAANGTFDPSVAGAGTHTISYTVSQGSCSGTDNIVIEVFDTPDATITDPGDFCSNDGSVNLTAVTSGGNWSGVGITDAVAGTFDPVFAGIGNHTISYTVGTGSCVSTDDIVLVVNAVPDATITDPSDFCSSDAAVNLTSATVGGSWSGPGITDAANGTFDPSVAGAGTHTISYTVSQGSCSGTDNIVIEVFDTPDATITDPGEFCSNDGSVNLTAVTSGGNWSGVGITDAVNGTFDPVSAGIGNHTISYTVGTGSCVSTDDIVLVVNAVPDATITDPGDFCSSDAAVNLTSATVGGSWSGPGITDAANGTFDPSVAGAGTHTISYTVSQGSCSGTDNIAIEVFDTPDASITDPGEFCSNDGSVNLTAVTSGGNWSGSGITDAVTGTFDPVFAGIGNHTISYTVGIGSCVSTDDIVLVVNAVPDATITDPGDFCSSDAAVNLTSATVGGSWSGPGITDAANGIFDPSVAGAGTHTISYTVSQGSCSGTDNIVIEVFDTPDATITDPGDFCSNDGSVNLTAVTSGGNWSGVGITDAVAGTFDPVFAGIGNHTISYTVGTGSCVSTDDIVLVVNAVPDATITDPSDFCSSDAAVNLTSATVGGSWSGPGITDAANGTFDPSVAGAGTHTISYTVSQGSCSGTDNIVIEVFDTPDATITDPGEFCSNDGSVNLTAVTSGGNWSGVGITDAVNGTFDPVSAGIGNHTISYTVGTGSCVSTDDIVLVVNAVPDATITDPGDFCSSDAAVNLTSATVGGSWSGPGITDAANGTFDPSVAGAGTHTISYTVSQGSCSGTDNIAIEVFDTPDATITDPGDFCISDLAVCLNAVTVGGEWSGEGIVNSANGMFNPQVAGIGNHTIHYNVINGNCSSSSELEIEVVDAPDATIDEVGVVCQNDEPITLGAVTAGGVWSGVGIIDADLGVFDPSVSGSGEFIITYDVSVGSCYSEDQVSITVMKNANATISEISPLCYSSIQLQLDGEDAEGTWNGSYVDDFGVFDVGLAGPGEHMVTYSIDGMCGDIDQVEITVYPGNIISDFEIIDPACYGGNDGSVEFEIVGGTAPFEISWDSGYADTSFVGNLYAGNYMFTITDDNGCFGYTPVVVINEGSKDCIRIPDAFTPNGDGINDCWEVENLMYYPSSVVLIYNRWGQLIYEGGAGVDPWDGTFDGEPVPVGSYIYIVQPKSGLKDEIGVVTIIR